ncbi:MAG: PilZ domain-containing protein [Acidiferrobacterales bacterium]
MDRKILRPDGSPVIPDDAVWVGRTLSQSHRQTGYPESAPRGRGQNSHQRISIRTAVPYQALINYGMNYSAVWRIHDISMSGAFVEMAVGDLGAGASVEFVIRFRRRDRLVEHRLPATAIRVQSNGVALKFGDYSDDAYTDLINLLYG